MINVMAHYLKIFPQFFDDIVYNHKSFEIRKNDRDFQVGDFIVLQEYNDGDFTGRCILAIITYILSDTRYNLNGYVTFSFDVIKIDK